MEENKKKKTMVTRVFAVIVAILYAISGYYFLAHPIISLNIAAVFFIISFICAGVMEVINYFKNRKDGVSVWTLVLGIINIVLGIYLLTGTFHLVVFIPYMLAFWAIFNGVSSIGLAFTQKKNGNHWISHIIIGIIMIIVGIMMFNRPIISILTASFLFAVAMWTMVINYLIAAFTK